MKTDIVIVGTGVSGLYCALNLPRDKKIVMVTKADDDKSDSFLAQGGICVLKDENDYKSVCRPYGNNPYNCGNRFNVFGKC